MLQMLPGNNGTMMHLLLVKLGWSTTKDRMGLALVEALSIAMIESYVSY